MASDLPTLVMSMLSDDYLFFNEGEIAWNGSEHYFAGIQVNATQMDELDSMVRSFGYDDIRDFILYFEAFLSEVEKDKEICVPRAEIAPGIQEALPEGPLTGITFANLAACNRAIVLRKIEDSDAYGVMYDVRLGQGIPCFFDLVARMIWDLRQCSRSLKGQPFDIGFASCRNLDANQYFGDVTESVAGAQENPIMMHVDCPPEINLDAAPSKTAAREVEREKVQQPYSGLGAVDPLLVMPFKRIASSIASAGAQRVAYVVALAAQHKASLALESARRERDDAEKDLREYQRLLSEYRWNCQRTAKLKAEIEEAEADESRLAGELPALTKMVDALNDTMLRLEDQRTSLEKEVSQVPFFAFGKRADLKREQEQLVPEINEARQKLDKANKEKSESSSRLEEKRAWLSENKPRLENLKQLIDLAEEKLGGDAEAEEERRRNRVDEAKAALKQLREERDEAYRRYRGDTGDE